MARFPAFLLLLIGSSVLAAAQTTSHLDPGNVNQDCPNCQQMEQGQPDQQVIPLVPHVAKNNNKYAFFVPWLFVTNTDSQKIKQVTWQCTYIHAASGETIATYTFVDKRNIARGKLVLLQRGVFIPMAQVLSHPRVITVNTNADFYSEHPQVRQVIAIKEVKYADGTIKTP